jgi:hypothetical protein
MYALRRQTTELKWLVTLLLATFGCAYFFGGWMVKLYAGFGPKDVAATYAGPTMSMPMPPDSTVIVEHPMAPGAFEEHETHTVDTDLLIQDTHVHMPMYGVIAGALSLVTLGLVVPRAWRFGLITLVFAAPWLDFAGMWLTKFASPHCAVLTVVGGWAMGLGYMIVTALALWQMWLSKKGVAL